MKERKEQLVGNQEPGAGSRELGVRNPKSQIRNPKSAFLLPGLTLIELIVSVAILVIMILAFGMIITQTQQVVSGSQATMRTNNTAASIARVIRQDLQKITKNGFLCITRKYDNSTSTPYFTPVLIFSTAGLTQSKTTPVNPTDPVIGLGGISCYGYCTNSSSGDSGNPQAALFLRQAWALIPLGTGVDVWPIDLADLQTLPRTDVANPDINDLVNQLRGLPWGLPRNLSIPPENLSEINDLWKVLSSESNKISIMWTDGTTDTNGNLNWYGIYYDSGYRADGKDSPSWSGTPGKEWENLRLNDNVPEFRNDGTGDGGYRALWTRHDQNNWPKAIKIKFMIYDKGLVKVPENTPAWNNIATYNTDDYVTYDRNYYRSDRNNNTNHRPSEGFIWWDLQGIWYEVICPIGQ